LIPGARYHVVDGAGHLNCIFKEQFKRDVASWIGRGHAKTPLSAGISPPRT